MSFRSWRLILAVGVAVVALLALAAWEAYRAVEHVAAAFVRQPPSAKPANLAARLRDVRFHTPAGTEIAAWYLPPANGAVVVYQHGARADRSALLPEARALAAHGYGALLLDAPGRGESGGATTWGLDAQDAVRGAVDFVAAQPEVRDGAIGAYGFSMGSSVVAHEAAADPRVRAVVLAGAFTTYENEMTYEWRKWGPITAAPALWEARRLGMALDDLRSVDVVGAIAPRPILFVAGSDDPVVGLADARALYDAAGGPKDIDVIEGAGHGGYLAAAGDAYVERLRRFFDGAIGPR